MKIIAMLMMLTTMIMSGDPPYDLKMPSIGGEEVDFSTFTGKNLLIVNVASQCGFTRQYAGLEELHRKYGDKVVVLGFPANDFGAQEPGSNLEIAQFCEKNFGVTFQMFEKITVKGEGQHALYRWLKEKTGKEPSWNFCKYLVKPDGTVQFFPSNVEPMDDRIVKAL